MKTAEEREKLESLLNEVPDKINGEVPVPGNIPPELHAEPVIDINLADLRIQCTGEARKMILNAILFLFQDELAPETRDYINDKLEVDVMSLSGMIYQLRVNEAMQKAMVEEVNRGFIHPRMFEVFGQLSKAIGEINKQMLQTVEAIKATYKDIKNDLREQKNEAMALLPPQKDETPALAPHAPPALPQNDGSLTTFGTKELIQSTRKQRPGPPEEIQDIHVEN